MNPNEQCSEMAGASGFLASPEHAAARKALRQAMRARRRALPDAERVVADAALQARVIAHPWFVAARQIALYEAFDGEVSTAAVAQAATAAGKQVLYARIEAETLVFVTAAAFHHTAGGLPVPEGPAAYLAPTDLLLVPGLAFDAEGQRLGFGRGHFDRVLAHLEVRTIGMAYSFQLVPRLPVAPWDRPVAVLVTEDAVHDFGFRGTGT